MTIDVEIFFPKKILKGERKMGAIAVICLNNLSKEEIEKLVQESEEYNHKSRNLEEEEKCSFCGKFIGRHARLFGRCGFCGKTIKKEVRE